MRFIIGDVADWSFTLGLDEKYHKLLQPFGLQKNKDDYGRDFFTIDLNHYKDLAKIME